jgi:hypothetical protein
MDPTKKCNAKIRICAIVFFDVKVNLIIEDSQVSRQVHHWWSIVLDSNSEMLLCQRSEHSRKNKDTVAEENS